VKRILVVSNGHGEEAIAVRLASEVLALAPEFELDHLALVGEFGHPSQMHDVGPRRAMPSGGLIAMGNVRNIARDVGGGLVGLTFAQLRFLRAVRGTYAAVVAVGDTYALLMSLRAKAPTVYVGTAKSVFVAPYGPIEERLLRRARAIFVRDEATAARLRASGTPASAPGNVIVDMFAVPDDPRADEAFADFAPGVALFPGSRGGAYDEGLSLAGFVRDLARERPRLGGVLSIAPGLDAQRFATAFAGDGWAVRASGDAARPFDLYDGERVVVRAWRGELGPLLSRATIVIGQAGTANEAAAGAGLPVVAYAPPGERANAWYRKRQRGLLGDALLVVSEPTALAEIGALLDDPARRARMGTIGRERMGAPGGARAIAQTIVALARVGA
jgi:uncharacterized protein (TIGR03492 family)